MSHTQCLIIQAKPRMIFIKLPDQVTQMHLFGIAYMRSAENMKNNSKAGELPVGQNLIAFF